MNDMTDADQAGRATQPADGPLLRDPASRVKRRQDEGGVIRPSDPSRAGTPHRGPCPIRNGPRAWQAVLAEAEGGLPRHCSQIHRWLAKTRLPEGGLDLSGVLGNNGRMKQDLAD